MENGWLNSRLNGKLCPAWPPWMPNLDQSRGMFRRAIDTLDPPHWFDAWPDNDHRSRLVLIAPLTNSRQGREL